MKRINFDRNKQRLIRQKRKLVQLNRIDNSLPRLLVTKTNAHIVAQLIDIEKSVTIVSSSSLQLKLTNGNKENAIKVGTDIATKALKAGVTAVSFDCGGSKYHGRVAALADAARAAGLKF
ncbi:MAG: 50S ribosomal protein L18 [Mycoplasma sp.]